MLEILTKEFLIKELIENKKTIKQLAKEINCSISSIDIAKRKYNIYTRPDYNLINKKFGRLRVVEKSYVDNRGQRWKCLCKCGKIIYSTTNDLTSGHTSSCGCKCEIKMKN